MLLAFRDHLMTTGPSYASEAEIVGGVRPLVTVEMLREIAVYLSARRARGTLRGVMRNRFDQLAKQIGQEALGPDDVLRVGIVVASELPRDRSTLLVRLMASGQPLAQAIEEQVAPPPNAHERAVAEQILPRLQNALRKQPRRTRKEQEFIVAMHKTWEDARTEARTKGRAEVRADDVLTALRVRGSAVPEAARKRILGW